MSPSRVVKDIDAQINRVLRKINLRKLGIVERNILADLKQNLVDSRIYAQAYELSEERVEQLQNSNLAKKWLDQARKNILTASEYDIFDAIEVAHLSAQIDQTISDLK